MTAWLSFASGVEKTSVVGQSAPTWISGTVERLSSVTEIVRWIGLRCEDEESAGNGSASACATMKASRLLAMVRPRYIRCRCNLGGEVPIHHFQSVRPRSGARNNALDDIPDDMLRDPRPTL